MTDKYATIDSWTYDRFEEARQNNQQVIIRNLQQWALSAASQFENFDFRASDRWVVKFERRHRICQRKITKFVTERETATRDEILAAAEDFRIQARDVIPNFGPDFVINTDQTDLPILKLTVGPMGHDIFEDSTLAPPINYSKNQNKIFFFFAISKDVSML